MTTERDSLPGFVGPRPDLCEWLAALDQTSLMTTISRAMIGIVGTMHRRGVAAIVVRDALLAAVDGVPAGLHGMLVEAIDHLVIRFYKSSDQGVPADPDAGGFLGPAGLDSGTHWIRLLAPLDDAGRYAWVEASPAEAGGWTDGPRRGSIDDPAHEAGGCAGASVPAYVIASRDPLGRLTFFAEA